MRLNKVCKIGIYLIGGLFITTLARGQTAEAELESLIEDLVWQADMNEQEQQNAVEIIYQLAANPININQTSEEELNKLFFLNGFQLFALNEYIQEYGDILSLYELVFIPGFDSTTVHRMMPFVEAIQPAPKSYQGNAIRQKGSLTYKRTFEEADGYKPDTNGTTTYLGAPNSWQLRHHFQMGSHTEIYLTADQDAGEQFLFDKQQQGFDFTSFSITTQKIPQVDNFLLGDFKVCAGQGLALWNGFGSFKSLSSTSSQFRSKTLQPYHSTGEAQYFRGVALSKNFKNWTVVPFFSYTKRNATLQTDNNLADFISGYYTSALHNTASAYLKRARAKESIAGAVVEKQWRYLQVGGCFFYQQWSYPYKDESSSFSAEQNNVASVFYKYINGKIIFYGEAALQTLAHMAIVQGAHWQPANDVHVNIAMRYLPQNYFNIYANPLSESSSAQNEWGVLTKLAYKLPRYYALQLYWDLFRIPTTSYGSYKPYTGYEMAMQLSRTPSEYQVKAKISVSEKTHNLPTEELISPARRWEERTTYKGQLQLRKEILHTLQTDLKIAGTIVTADQKEETGWLANVTLKKDLTEKIALTLSYAQFYTSDYLARIYMYEHDVRYAFSIPSFSDKGSRAYLVMNVALLNQWHLALKIARTFYPDEQTLRTGPAELATNHKTDANIQIRWKF